MLKLSSYMALAALLVLACQPDKDSSSTNGSATTGAGFSSTGPGTGSSGTPTTTDGSTSLATGDAGTSSTTTTSSSTDSPTEDSLTAEATAAQTGFILIPDGGDGPLVCDCPAGEMCVRSQGVDSWFISCALPPAGCDPGDVCGPACVAACALPPPQAEGCDGREPPEWLECGKESGFECSTWTGNCPAGEKCVAWPGLGYMECQAIAAAPDAIGEPCTGPFEELGIPDSCVAGAGCWGVDAMTKQQVCAAHCEGTPADPVCPANTACQIDPDSLVAVCLPT